MEKQVQVQAPNGELLFTYMINLRGLNYEPADHEFVAEAKKMAAEDHLAKEEQLSSLRYAIVR
jgi:hypothetical protein